MFMAVTNLSNLTLAYHTVNHADFCSEHDNDRAIPSHSLLPHQVLAYALDHSNCLRLQPTNSQSTVVWFAASGVMVTKVFHRQRTGGRHASCEPSFVTIVERLGRVAWRQHTPCRVA